MDRILIFGLGAYFRNRIDLIYHALENDEIIGYVDNDASFIENCKFQPFYTPDKCNNLKFDFIIVTSTYFLDIKEQLLKLNIQEDKIIQWERYYSSKRRNERIVYKGVDRKGKKCLIISTKLSFDGAPIAAIHAACVLFDEGYQVFIAAESGDNDFIGSITEKGIEVWIYPGIPYYLPTDVDFSSFDTVIVNTFTLIKPVYEICKERRVIWWIHEGKDRYTRNYERTKQFFPECAGEEWLENVSIYAVSNRARDNFKEFYPETKVSLWMPGIPDEYNKTEEKISDTDTVLTCAIMGPIAPLKGQQTLIEAVSKMPAGVRNCFRILIIGDNNLNIGYAQNINNLAQDMSQIHILGKKSHNELYTFFPGIDIVVCASLEETLSLAVVEGMMFGKICITTRSTGIAEYIINGINGFVFDAGDVPALESILEYIVANREDCIKIANNARKTYEKYFSMQCFSKRTMEVIEEIV